jgi:hypothetical protein
VTAPVRLRPTFLVIGAQKAGTTSLHQYLCEHPAVLCANVKEVSYFHRYYDRGEWWYRAHFPLALRRLVIRARTGVWPAVAEATAAYLFDRRAPARVHAFDPRMKLVVILRDPVTRAYSHYQMEYRWQRETLPFEDALDREEEELASALDEMFADDETYIDLVYSLSYVARGRYMDQLERWFAHFPREQMLVLTSDDLLAHPADAVSEVLEFLGLPEHHGRTFPRRGAHDYPQMNVATRERLARTFEADNLRLEDFLKRTLGWTRRTTHVRDLRR